MNGNRWAGRASAEFALIVLGVLVAFAVEGWWTNRQDRQAESEYISDLYDELERNVGALVGVDSLRAAAEVSLENALQLLEAGRHRDSAEVVVLGLVRGGFFVSIPRITDAVFRDLQNSGRLQLVRENDLRRGIMDHYGRLDATLVRMTGTQEDIHSGLAALLARHIPPGVGVQTTRGGVRSLLLAGPLRPLSNFARLPKISRQAGTFDPRLEPTLPRLSEKAGRLSGCTRSSKSTVQFSLGLFPTVQGAHVRILHTGHRARAPLLWSAH